MSELPSGYDDLVRRDSEVVWHPYSSMVNAPPVLPVAGASGTRITLADGRVLIDGMASWWCVIQGYNHPRLNAAIQSQLESMAHVMFGGLTHEPAIRLAEELVRITPDGLDAVFFSDSGSVSVEVALKMAIQYWAATGKRSKQRFITVRNGYHGDTLGAMSVCDPVTGMHTLFSEVLPRQFFADRPNIRFSHDWDESDLESIKQLLQDHHSETAAVILEPIVQGAGGMWFYHPEYLRSVRELCHEYDVLLILDEIATGFGRTGKLFASEHANVSPDIMCLGKALTGGYLSFAATLATGNIAETISMEGQGAFMHGPTFMGNPLAAAVALENIRLLMSWDWQEKIKALETQMREELAPCSSFRNVADVRVLGGIGVVELTSPVNLQKITPEFVNQGVWIRPFGKLVYIMPPYIMEREELSALTTAICNVVSDPRHYSET
jgi:adenosylmethionine-8-amino-7-oxononanoate aminotransferase